ncbi:hypothetical protein [Cellulomonas hominis]|uniref:hypothetical protein n=1 Tax=Cellulomonas hominis TaxID=156981 RepID=UPI0014441D92|nr:hypothetical protein [Cellulomonas hominis]NKY11209.1 hypothetical protein [Cellulomonas hominis]
MSQATEPLHTVTATHADETGTDLVDYCARPKCRTEFRQSAGRGRRRDYCSETCRRIADKEYKQAKATVEHFERLAERSRHDVRAFGRAADERDSTSDVSADVAVERAKGAIERARAVLRFAGDSGDAYATELRALSESIEPALRLLR